VRGFPALQLSLFWKRENLTRTRNSALKRRREPTGIRMRGIRVSQAHAVKEQGIIAISAASMRELFSRSRAAHATELAKRYLLPVE